MEILSNLIKVQQDIIQTCKSVHRDPSEITVVAVTKNIDVQETKNAIECNLQHLGENRPDKFTMKLQEIGQDVNWHFIGSLQSRKVKEVINQIDYLHSLDRISLANEINKRANKVIRCFVQVNVSGEESKQGVEVSNLTNFIKEIEQLENIQVIGLMTMAPFTDDENVIRECFAGLRECRNIVQQLGISNVPCTELSMGMSNDYQIAIEEGATFIRLGTTLFGK